MSQFVDAVLSAKTAVATAGGTVASAAAYLLGIVPDPIGKLAALVGVILSLIMCNYWRAQTKKVEIETEKLMLERDKLAKELKGGD